jgi:hypothetical protein
MLIQITAIVLRVCGILALILGLLFWTGNTLNLIPVHMLLGLLVVLSLWIVGVAQAFAPGGSWPLAVAALLVGALVIAVGIRQSSLLVGPFHWVIQVIHLLLGGLAVGLGQIAAARYRKRSAAVAAARGSA